MALIRAWRDLSALRRASSRMRPVARDKVERIRRGEVAAKSLGRARPFVTIPATLFATMRIRSLPGAAVRVLLWAEAAWHPAHGAPMPQRQVAAALGVRRSTVSGAIACLVEAGLLLLKTAAVKPTTMGGAAGRGSAAVFDLPHRKARGTVRFDPGDQRLPGFIKAWSNDLRGLAGRVSDEAARVLLIAAARPRKSDGTLLRDDDVVVLTADRLARDLPGLSKRTAARAVNELVAFGLVRTVRPHAGRRAAIYQPTGTLLTRIPHRKHARPPGGSPSGARDLSAAPLHGRVQGVTRLADKP